ncbi:hypothetical protein Pan181_03410 [Aeoliella mucimassa]|uniref:Uncharacterized protein n=1 Tax=Aeoliella mucimassa TaxID=2527972 RepID=A0A518AHE1_9BACT|nr:hypothetical protein Pan181_03410 [Aeoliella mucimassa]
MHIEPLGGFKPSGSYCFLHLMILSFPTRDTNEQKKRQHQILGLPLTYQW